jgi:hypothetical protein
METDIIANGINGATGDYLLPPQTEQEAAERAASQPEEEQAGVLKRLAKQASDPHLGALFDIDLTDPKDAGWAIVFHTAEDAAVKAAMQPLITHRQKQIGNDRIVKELEYRDGETVQQWLARHGMNFGDIDPEKVPFYILIVGSPTAIPFLFGHLLDAVYGVGRLSFKTAAEYAAYAQSVIAYETADGVPNTKEVCFFGPRQAGDSATELSATKLVKPLALGEGPLPSVVDRLAKGKFKLTYTARYLDPAASTKQALREIFRPANGGRRPCLLFTASHGMGWPFGDPHQPADQGALLCQDLARLGTGPVDANHYFAAADLPKDAQVHGLVCFHFACYGIGTPREDRFLHKDGTAPPQIATDAYFSPLPQALLTHPNGSALGVIGHVERAWPSSIRTIGAGPQLVPFINALSFILIGVPLGYALKDFNERYAALSASLGSLLEKKSFGLPVPDSDLASIWTARNDAEAYVLFGDPGVCVRKDRLA